MFENRCKAALHLPALRGKYLIQNRWANRVMGWVDGALGLWMGPKKDPVAIPRPQRLLLGNGAHLGDVILMTSILPALKRALPGVKIGVVVGSWSKGIVEGHPLIDEVFFVDHWKACRSNRSLREKWMRYSAMSKEVVERVRGYEVALEWSCSFPNYIPLYYRAGIGARVGYTSGGFGPLLTHPVRWEDKPQSAVDYFFALAERVVPLERGRERPILPRGKPQRRFEPKSYFLIHMGAGNGMKQWPVTSWRKLVERLVREGERCLFTGKGEGEKAVVREVIRDLPSCVDLCDQLSWEECVELVRDAKKVVGVDTSVGHVTGATETPAVLLYAGVNRLQNWSPLNDKAKILMKDMPCYPCFRPRGCETMECIRGVTVDEVYQAIRL